MAATIEPEPPAEERDAIIAAVSAAAPVEQSWAAAALHEGVEDGDSDP